MDNVLVDSPYGIIKNYHAKDYAYELKKRSSSDSLEKFTSTLLMLNVLMLMI